MKTGWDEAFLIFLIIILSCCALLALDPERTLDSYQFDEWRTADGLPADTVNAIAQTADGYLWIGTTRGLVRFDGARYETFDTGGDQEKTNWITHLFVDNAGVLWVGSQDGLRRYKQGTMETFSRASGLSGNFITCINEDIKGSLWIGTDANHLNRLREGRFVLFDEAAGLRGSRISSLFEDSKGMLWVGASRHGLFKFLGGRFVKVEITGLDANYAINVVYEDRSGCRWGGTNKGLLATKGEVSRLYTTFIGGLSNNDVKAILEDSSGNLWVGTANGLNRIQKKPSGEVVIEHFFENTVITCLFEDREKSLWVGTSGCGLRRLLDAVFTTYTVADGLPNNYIYSLCEDGSGEIWVGSGYGLSRWRDGQFHPFPIRLDNPKRTLHADPEGNLWVGTGGSGLFRIKDDEVFAYPPPGKSLASNHILALCSDSRGNLWVGTDKGLHRCRGAAVDTYTTRHGLSGSAVNSVYEDGDGNIWVGTSRGLDVLKGGEFSREHIQAYLVGVPVSCIYYEDRQQVFWIGTYGEGLKRLKQGKLFSYTIENGLASSNIYQILEDGKGNFWLSSDSGVLKVDKVSLNDLARGRVDKIGCVTFGLSDGMRSVECSRSAANSALETSSGRFWFATKGGISVVDPEKIRINKLPPAVLIETVVFDDEVTARETWKNKPKVVRKGVKDVAVHFTAVTFISPQKVIFRYRLEGYEKDWRSLPTGGERRVLYADLPAGRYTFRVTACNSDGVWNLSGDTVTFFLKPGFFHTTLFKMLIGLAVLLIALAGYFLYKKNFFRHEEKYKGSTLDPGKAEEYLKKLIYLLEVKKIYRDEEVSLHLLAEKLAISTHHLSQIINEKMNKNFLGLINSYRVEEARKRLIDPADQHLSILGIAFEVGFNSKAAFNRAFKKYTHMTPSEYRKKHAPDHP